MRDLTPIKVKIGLKGDGSAKYPDFNSLPVVKNSGADWSKYIDIHGTGWHYDKQCGHDQEDDTSTFGEQWGMILIPGIFAKQAIATFPSEVEVITEEACGVFFEERAHAHEPDEIVDSTVMENIKTRRELGLSPLTNEAKIIDPEDATPGIRKNKNKRWADYKGLKGINIKTRV